MIAFGANVCAINYYQQSPLDLAKNNDHHDMVDLLFSVGGELGCSVCSKFEEFVCLPHAPLGSPGTEQDGGYKEKEEHDWKLMSSQLLRSDSLSRRAEESYSAWLEWRKKAKVRESENPKMLTYDGYISSFHRNLGRKSCRLGFPFLTRRRVRGFFSWTGEVCEVSFRQRC